MQVNLAQKHRHTGAYALTFREGRVLLVQKGRGPYVHSWDLPGGGIEFGEAPEVAVAREVAEETGLSIRRLELRTILSHRVEYHLASGNVENLHHIGVIYRAWMQSSGPLRRNPDGRDSLGARWVDMSTVASLPLSPFAAKLLNLPHR